jgi:hypothetical protein
MNCKVCNNEFVKIYSLPLYYCNNCFLVFYLKDFSLKKLDCLDYKKQLQEFLDKYLSKKIITYSDINYSLNLNCKMDGFDDTLYIVYNSDFLLNDSFCKSSYVYNDYISCYYFNSNTIKKIANKNKFEIVYMEKIYKYIIFKVKKNEIQYNTLVDLLIYEDILNELYSDEIIENYYLNYILFRNNVQNKIIENYKNKKINYNENDLNNYTILFSMFK